MAEVVAPQTTGGKRRVVTFFFQCWWHLVLMASQGTLGNIPAAVQSHGSAEALAAPFSLQINPWLLPQPCHPMSLSPP